MLDSPLTDRLSYITPLHVLTVVFCPGQFHGIAGNVGNHGNDKKLNKSHQILNPTKRNIKKLCLPKITNHKTVRTKFS